MRVLRLVLNLALFWNSLKSKEVRKSKYKFQNTSFPKSKSEYRSEFWPQLKLSSKWDVFPRKQNIILRLSELTGISLSRLKLMSVAAVSFSPFSRDHICADGTTLLHRNYLTDGTIYVRTYSRQSRKQPVWRNDDTEINTYTRYKTRIRHDIHTSTSTYIQESTVCTHTPFTVRSSL